VNHDPANDAVIFDVDGTLWDSAPGILSCLVETFEYFDLEVPGEVALRAALGPPLDMMLRDLGFPSGQIEAGRLEYRRRYFEHGEAECEVYAGIVELLERLAANGRSLAVATSKGRETAHRMLEAFGLTEYFDSIRAADMATAAHGKVHLIAAALTDLNTRSAVMVGDRNFDIEGGLSNGLYTIGVNWGYAPTGELEAAGAHVIVDTVSQLASVLIDR